MRRPLKGKGKRKRLPDLSMKLRRQRDTVWKSWPMRKPNVLDKNKKKQKRDSMNKTRPRQSVRLRKKLRESLKDRMLPLLLMLKRKRDVTRRKRGDVMMKRSESERSKRPRARRRLSTERLRQDRSQWLPRQLKLITTRKRLLLQEILLPKSNNPS
jgi:hypothetical protein